MTSQINTEKKAQTTQDSEMPSAPGSGQDAMRAALAIDQDRLWGLLMDLASIGATENGGVNRQALTDLDAVAVNKLCGWARERDLEFWIDEIGNLFVEYPGTDPEAEPVLLGSHLDSQPTGGRFDGVYGVLAALEVIEVLRQEGIKMKRPVWAVAWINEEGSRFSTGVMGSGFAIGRFELDKLKALVGGDGVLLADALSDFHDTVDAPVRSSKNPNYHAYLEAHIEQGPILEELNKPVGIVSGIQGIRRLTVTVFGKEAHSGTTPASQRQDAVKAAAQYITLLEAQTRKEGDDLRLTIGKLDVFPNSPNTVPNRVDMIVEIRHPEEETLQSVSEKILALAGLELLGCKMIAKVLTAVTPTVFDEGFVKTGTRVAEELNLPHEIMMSGAGHDALNLNRICKTCMVFAPCKAGISHAENEYASPEDLAKATQVLAAMAVRVAS